jgi:hypothetical protein
MSLSATAKIYTTSIDYKLKKKEKEKEKSKSYIIYVREMRIQM